MDLTPYIKKSQTAGRSAGRFSVEKRCLECGRKLDREQNHLYFQSFCSHECKGKYVNILPD